MKKNCVWLLGRHSLVAVFFFTLTFIGYGKNGADVAGSAYLFSSFRGNGEDGLHLAYSHDGLKWTALKGDTSFLKPQVGGRLMRDPCVVQGPDGTFHMVWTDSWTGTTIGYASTRDFIHWSEQKSIPVMAQEPTSKNCWAPEIVYDRKRDQFMIFWATTIPGKFTETWFDGKNDNNHRIYATTTKDFESFTPTKLFFEPGFNVIDSTLLVLKGKVFMFFKDETRYQNAKKNLRLAVANDIAGPYKVVSKPVTLPGEWVEGPTAIRIGDYVYVYYDSYTKRHYGALRSRDMQNWEDVTGKLIMPEGIRHGTAFAVSNDVLDALLKGDTSDVNGHVDD